jgi:hypothetical protein
MSRAPVTTFLRAFRSAVRVGVTHPIRQADAAYEEGVGFGWIARRMGAANQQLIASLRPRDRQQSHLARVLFNARGGFAHRQEQLINVPHATERNPA